MRYKDGAIPDLFDIVRIPVKSLSPRPYQPENFIFNKGEWAKVGVYDQSKLGALLDSPASLWTNEPFNNRIPASYFTQNKITSSLLLVKVDNCRLQKSSAKKQIRALFTYNGGEYDLPITDIHIEKEYENKHSGLYKLNDKIIVLCLSLGEPFLSVVDSEPCCYKLVASVIRMTEGPEIPQKSYSVDAIRKDHPNAYVKWSPEDDKKLKNGFLSGKDATSLAEVFKRKIGAIRSRLKKIGLIN